MPSENHDRFIPTTCERKISGDIVFRPIRSWHSGVYAGEGLRIVAGDRSGCLFDEYVLGLRTCQPPLPYTHRLYWHVARPERTISAFLSYPNGLGACSEYFWEISAGDDPERFFGPNAETEMEQAIAAYLSVASTEPTPSLAAHPEDTERAQEHERRPKDGVS